jgi:hypothetical protein
MFSIETTDGKIIDVPQSILDTLGQSSYTLCSLDTNIWKHSIQITEHEFNNIRDVLLGKYDLFKLSEIEYNFGCKNLLFPLEIENKETLSKFIKSFIHGEVIEVSEMDYVNIKKSDISSKLIPIQIFCVNNAIKLISIEEGIVIYSDRGDQKNYIHNNKKDQYNQTVNLSMINTRFNALSYPNTNKFTEKGFCICVKCVPIFSSLGYYGSDGVNGFEGHSACRCLAPNKDCRICRCNNDICRNDKCKGLLTSNLRLNNFENLISDNDLHFIEALSTNYLEFPKLCPNHKVKDIQINILESDIIKITNGVRRNICAKRCDTNTVKFGFIRRHDKP